MEGGKRQDFRWVFFTSWETTKFFRMVKVFGLEKGVLIDRLMGGTTWRGGGEGPGRAGLLGGGEVRRRKGWGSVWWVAGSCEGEGGGGGTSESNRTM